MRREALAQHGALVVGELIERSLHARIADAFQRGGFDVAELTLVANRVQAVGLHGLRGAVRVEVLTDRPEDRFAPGRVLHLEADARPLTIAWARPVEVHGDWIRITPRGFCKDWRYPNTSAWNEWESVGGVARERRP